MLRMKSGNNFFDRSKYMYSLFTLAVILLTAFTSYSVIVDHLKAEVTQSNTLLLKQKQQTIDSELASIQGSITNLLMNSTVKSFMYDSTATEYERFKIHESLQQELISLCLVHQGVESAYLYSQRANKILTNDTASDAGDFNDMNWKVQLAMPGDDVLYSLRKIKENSVFENEIDVLTMLKGYPFPNAYNASAVVVNLDESLLYESIANKDAADGEQLFVIDSDGKVLMHQDKTKLSTYTYNQSYYHEVMANDSGRVSVKLDGRSATLFYVTSPATGWKYINISQASPVTELLSNVIWLLSVLLFAILLLAVGSMLVLNRWVNKPIYGFVNRVAEKIRQDEKNKKLPPGSFMDLNNLEAVFSNVIDDNKKIQKQMDKSLPLVKWRLVTDILFGNRTDYRELKEYFDMLHMDLYPQNYIVLIADLDNKTELENRSGEQGLEFYAGVLCRQAEDYMNEACRGVAVVQNDEKVVLILSFEDPSDYQTLTVSTAELLKSFMLSYFDVTVTIAVGCLCEELEGVQKSFRSASQALQYKAVMGAGSVIWADDMQIPDESSVFQLISGIDALDPCLKGGDEEGIAAFLDNIFQEISEKALPFDSIAQIVTQILMRAVRVAVEFGLPAETINDQFGDMYSKLYGLEALEDIENYVFNILRYVLDILSEKKAAKGTNELISQVVTFLDENYMHPDISLAYVADAFYVSRQHLSKTFKDVTNGGFFDYLVNLRMSHAKQMLEDTTRQIKQIAEAVGYTNVHSFIKIFKKQTGMTPTQYRNIHKNDKA